MIHERAVVDPGAEIDPEVEIGPCAVVEAEVRIAKGCVVGAHAVLHRGTVLEESVAVAPHAVLGGLPQDLRFDPQAPSGVWVEKGARIREFVSINRSHEAEGWTRVGAGAFLMAGAHMGHGCTVGENAVLANNVMLAGHVSIGAYSFIGGGAGFHQFVRVGESAMVSGLARISRDVAPFLMVSERDEVNGLNLIGMRRRGMAAPEIAEIKQLFRLVYRSLGGQRAKAEELLIERHETLSESSLRFLKFFAESRRGFVQPDPRNSSIRADPGTTTSEEES